MKNIIKSKFSETDRTEIDGLITELEGKFDGKTEVLSAEERQRFGSVNEQNKLIVNKARDYRQSKPELSAPNVDWNDFEDDYQSRVFTENCINRLMSMVHSLQSTKIMHDYDNYQDALRDRNYSKYQNDAGEDGYAVKVEEYKQFFTKSGKNNPSDGGGENGGGNTE